MDQPQQEIDKLVKDNRLKIGKAIRQIREKKGYSQDHLADLMSVSRSTISKIENGRFSVSIDYLSKLSIYLNFSLLLIED